MANDAASSSIAVTVRVRPFTIREAAQLTKLDDGPLFLGDGSLAGVPAPKLLQKGIRPVVKVVDDKCLVFDPPEENPVQRFSRSVVPQKRTKDQTFAFDRVFDENTTQSDVYEATTKNLLDNVLDGYNATVFAYGATGCGKTHTITGTAQQPGIIFLTMQELFERISDVQEDKVTEISLSYLEIYNETIRDLLEPGTSKGGLMLREDSNQAVSVAGLSSHHPKNVQEVMDMIVRGNELRTMSPTEANATSSRSHAVLQINVSQKDRNADVNEPHTMATLSIIDLAGSERASATKNRGERLLEGANINKSLLALGSCINALCDSRKGNHVPYRNSKLTRLLKFSLGGNCKTVMIVCVSPSSSHFDETQNTLRYANRAKNIQTKVTRNVYNVNRHVKDFLKKIDEQMALINELKSQQKDYESIAFGKFRKQNEKKDSVAKEGISRLRSAYEHCLRERQERTNHMKKLRQIERRISLINAWILGFDRVCETREDEEAPRNLTAMRKTANGILVELEASRHHCHQKLEKDNWQRAIDSALQTGLKQLQESDATLDGSECSSLRREAELLKSNAEREFHSAVLEQEKTNEASLMQVLLQAHFETVAAVNQLLTMDEAAAVQAAKNILNKLFSACADATFHVIKPDGNLPVVEAFPPTKSGTPKRRKNSSLLGPCPLQPRLDPKPELVSEAVAESSPLKSSPRRVKFGSAKKLKSFTPKRKSPVKRAVRWRDDTENGTLAEYQKTPQKFDSTPESDATLPVPVLSSTQNENAAPNAHQSSSPIPAPPQPQPGLKPRSDRFQTGFLSRKAGGSPAFQAAQTHSSSAEPSPLREITSNTASGRRSLESKLKYPDKNSWDSGSGTENGATGSDSEKNDWTGSRDENEKIASALKRASSSRASLGGQSRIHRRRSPTAASTGSPQHENTLFTASHARRMVKSDKDADMNTNVLAAHTTPVMKNASSHRRRTTVGEDRGFHRTASRGASTSRLSMISSSSNPNRGSMVHTPKSGWR